jgi:hypothetical protein
LAGTMLCAALTLSCSRQDRAEPSSTLVESTSAVSGQWMYYPLDRLGGNYNTYSGYSIGTGVCPNGHFAYDLTGNVGDPIRAVADGTVAYECQGIAESSCGGCMSYIIIQHDGSHFTKYCHLGNATNYGSGLLSPQPAVRRGDPLGTMTVAGGVAHLHFALSNSLASGNGCLLDNRAGNCVDPSCPPGVPLNNPSNPCEQGCDGSVANQWVTSGGTVLLASCVPSQNAASWCANYQSLAGGSLVCGPNYKDDCNNVIDCGPCPAGQFCDKSSGLCAQGPPTCPGGSCGYRTGWCGVGAYCGSSGVINGTPNTLYQCNSAGGLASVINTCGGYECIYRNGLDDVCALGPVTCPVRGNGWYGPGLYCGLAQGMGYAQPYIVYYCSGPGANATVNQRCSNNCVVAPNGVNDHC